MEVDAPAKPAPATTTRRVKRRRTAAKGEVPAAIAPAPCQLFRLPFEILADVAGYFTTPKELLALARTCRDLCRTLTAPGAAGVWRAARARCVPAPLPEPTSQFTESAYAAFVFDGGTCDICGTRTKLMLHSFALRARLCLSRDCFSTFTKEKLQTHTRLKAEAWTPEAEIRHVWAKPRDRDTPWHPLPWQTHEAWPRMESHFSIELVQRNQDAFLASVDQASPGADERRADYEKHIAQVLIPRKTKIMENAVALQTWKFAYLRLVSTVKNINRQFALELCKLLECELGDLLVTQTYGQFHRCCTNELVTITNKNYTPAMHEVVRREVEELCASRERKESEAGIKRKQDIVASYYHQLRLPKPGVLMPSLSTFRQMPTIHSLEKYNGTPAQLEAELKNPASITAKLVGDMLEQWRKDVRRDLATILRVKPSKDRAATLAPAERSNARFVCTRCKNVSKSFREDGCLTLAGVCLHECHGVKKSKTYKWHTRYFAPAEKAIKIVNQALALCKVDPAAKDSPANMRGFAPRFACDSCSATIVMDFQQLVGHSARHEDMKITFLSVAQADAILAQPLEMGLHKHLADRTRKTVQQHHERIYGCRHCTQVRQTGTIADEEMEPVEPTPLPADATEPDAASSAPAWRTQAWHDAKAEPKVVLRDYNALRSHCKAKHGIADLRDEDFFRLVL